MAGEQEAGEEVGAVVGEVRPIVVEVLHAGPVRSQEDLGEGEWEDGQVDPRGGARDVASAPRAEPLIARELAGIAPLWEEP